MRKINVLPFVMVSCLLVAHSLFAGGRLTGSARLDILNIAEDSASVKSTVVARPIASDVRTKSPLAAAGMSLILPGAGQAYSGSYWTAGIMTCFEVAAITFAVIYTRKGDDKTTEFQQYADQHWSAVRYAQWINAHGADYNVSGNGAISISQDASLPPWQRVSFADINAWETQPKSEGFSHSLPAHGEQQYYELIGKYVQFKYGWDGYKDLFGNNPSGWDANGVPISDKTLGGYFKIPQQMNDYSTNRGKANDYYNTAAIAVGALVVNHIGSAIEAYFSTRSSNAHIITSDVGFRLDQLGTQANLATDLTLHVQL